MADVSNVLTPEDLDALKQFNAFVSNIPYKFLLFLIDLLIAFVIIFIGFKIVKLIRNIVTKALDKKKVDKAVVSFVDTSVNVGLKILVIIAAALVMGIQMASITTLAGSCVIAISLAVQGSLSNFAGGVLILLLRPFTVGDYIVDTASNQEGIVRSITIFYTKIQDIYGNIIVLPNGNLANTTIINKTNGSNNRQIKAEFSISYNEDIENARAVVVDAISSKSKYINDNSNPMVLVNKLDDSSISLEARFNVNKEYYYAAKTEALEIIKYALDDAGITIPFPQLDVHFDKETV